MSTIKAYTIAGNIVDPISGKILKGTLYINENGNIAHIEYGETSETHYIIPGFVDSHIHIESSMLMPDCFASEAVRHGSVAAVCDPHEIANVLGIDGIRLFIENGKKSGFKFFFGAPSCVPATGFDTAGACLDCAGIETLMADPDIWFLAEMMNYPGVIHHDPSVMCKISAAIKNGKPIDGHAPALSGEELKKYINAGITTDHECMTLSEAEEKLSLGMKVLIREGSVAKNFDDLYPLIDKYPDRIMLCSDDMHPDDLKRGYLTRLLSRALSKNIDLFHVIGALSVNPVRHYKLPVGLLQVGQPADFAIIDRLEPGLNVLGTYINGKKMFDGSGDAITVQQTRSYTNFQAEPIAVESLRVHADHPVSIKIIDVIDKEIYTRSLIETLHPEQGEIKPDLERDILKITVINRYAKNARPAVGFIKGFGLKKGAICSTVAHDSHNIVAIGTNDSDMMKAINAVIDAKGGISTYADGELMLMELPIAGIISRKLPDEAAIIYEALDRSAKQLGSKLTAPFMTMAFMALIVVPELKICDKGLFDVLHFKFDSLIQ